MKIFQSPLLVNSKNRGDITMRYHHKRRLLITTHKETRLLNDAKKLLFEMLRCSGCRNNKISAAYQHLSILLEQYRYLERKRLLKMGSVRRFAFRLLSGMKLKS